MVRGGGAGLLADCVWVDLKTLITSGLFSSKTRPVCLFLQYTLFCTIPKLFSSLLAQPSTCSFISLPVANPLFLLFINSHCQFPTPPSSIFPIPLLKYRLHPLFTKHHAIPLSFPPSHISYIVWKIIAIFTLRLKSFFHFISFPPLCSNLLGLSSTWLHLNHLYIWSVFFLMVPPLSNFKKSLQMANDIRKPFRIQLEQKVIIQFFFSKCSHIDW